MKQFWELSWIAGIFRKKLFTTRIAVDVDDMEENVPHQTGKIVTRLIITVIPR
jgi:hypothetical protein